MKPRILLVSLLIPLLFMPNVLKAKPPTTNTTALVSYLFQNESYKNSRPPKNADINKDGEINAADVIYSTNQKKARELYKKIRENMIETGKEEVAEVSHFKGYKIEADPVYVKIIDLDDSVKVAFFNPGEYEDFPKGLYIIDLQTGQPDRLINPYPCVEDISLLEKIIKAMDIK